MRIPIILFAAAGVLALGEGAWAQAVVGGVSAGLGTPVGRARGSAAGRVTAPDVPTEVVTDTGRRTVERARGAADEATDASACLGGSLRAGMKVRDRNGATIGTIAEADGSGFVQIQTGTGVIMLSESSLRLQGGVAVSNWTEAELRASGNLKSR